MKLAGLLISATLAAILAAISIFNLHIAGQGVERDFNVVDGVPIEIFSPLGADEMPADLPAVVVVHGFSGNRQLMYGFGFTLARNGYVAALVDFAGHGASLNRLDSGVGQAGMDQLSANIETAIRRVQSLPFVDPARVAIVGHSMGAGVVARYGATHRDVASTIAVSLGGLGDSLPARADAPRNFLILVGANEFDDFKTGSLMALQAAYPDGVPSQTYGDFALSTARRLEIVPGVEHISILFNHDTYREMIRWLDKAIGNVARPDEHIQLDGRIGWVLLLYAAAAIGFYPLSQALFSPGRAPTPSRSSHSPAPARRPVPGWLVLLLSALGAVVAPVLMLVVPYTWMPLSVGNYVGVYFLVYGLLLFAGVALIQRVTSRRSGQSPAPGELGAAPGTARTVAGVVVLTAYALVTFGLTAHLTWTSFSLGGDRLWSAGIVALFALAYFWADESLVWRASRRARAGLYAVTKVILVAGLIAAIIAFKAPFFLLLLLPVLVVLFVWHGLYSYWLHALTGRPWAAAILNAVVFAWVIAATFAMV